MLFHGLIQLLVRNLKIWGFLTKFGQLICSQNMYGLIQQSMVTHALDVLHEALFQKFFVSKKFVHTKSNTILNVVILHLIRNSHRFCFSIKVSISCWIPVWLNWQIPHSFPTMKSQEFKHLITLPGFDSDSQTTTRDRT